MPSPPALFLITPVVEDAVAFRPDLAAVCAGAAPTALLLRLAPADDRTLVNRIKLLSPVAQAHEVTVIVADPGSRNDLAALVTRGGADGAQADDPARLEEVCMALKGGRNVGAGGLMTRHDAMVAGERGVDYVLFGEPRPGEGCPPLEEVVERAAWWAEIFQTACVAYGPNLADIPRLAATGAEFVALGDAVWRHPEGSAAAMTSAHGILAGTSIPA